MIATLSVRYVPLNQLTGYARNPRKNQHVIPRMVSSIKEFGFAIPVLVKPDYEIIDGHLRALAARELQMAEVPVIVADGWSEAQVKAFRLLANRSVNWAEWDDELLRLELEDLKDVGFDLDFTGFSKGELDSYFENVGLDLSYEPKDSVNKGLHDITFSLTPDQMETVESALTAIESKNQKYPGNDHSRSNALYFMACQYVNSGI